MATTGIISDTALRLERTIAAPAEQVFAAWTTAEALKRWFFPGEGFTTTVHALDVRPGGQYRVEMIDPSGASHVVHGTYREVARPTRLVFTWSWENKPEDGDTVVTIALTPQGKSTHLVLVHERFPTTQARDTHNQGWAGCLDRLTEFARA